MSNPSPRRRARRTGAFAAAAVVVAALAAAAPAGAANDPRWSQQWGPQRVNAPAAWLATTGSGVQIGVVDTGIDLAHEEFAGRVVASTTCSGTDGDPGRCSGNGQDDNGHGTHVAGTAAAPKDNGRGIAGIAPDAQLIVAKVLDAEGSGYLTDVDAGIRWVVDQGADVVNLSLGEDGGLLGNLIGGGGGNGISGAIEYAWSKGAVPVIASGNSNQELFGGSANYGAMNAIVVGASTRDDRIAAYSSPIGNAKWGIVAPGGAGNGNSDDDIISTFWVAGRRNSYAWSAGTSMATPHVAGAVALLRSQGLSRDAAVARVLETADRSVACGSTCRGRLDVAAAVGAPVPAPTTTAATAQPAPRPSPSRPRPAPVVPGPTAPPTVTPAPEPAPAPEETTTSLPAGDDAVITAAGDDGGDALRAQASTGASDGAPVGAAAAALVLEGLVAVAALRAYSRRRTVTTRP